MREIDCRICGKRHPQGIGASQMPTILGLRPKRNALDVYHELTRPARPDDDGPPTIDQHRGHRLEPLAAEDYWERTGRRGRKSGGATTHPGYPAFQVHIDFDVFADDSVDDPVRRRSGIMEAKAPRSNRFRRLVDHGLYQSELVQLYTQCAVARRAWGDLAFYCLEHGDGPLLIIEQTLDPAMGDFLLGIGQRFFDEHVVPRIPPDPSEWELLAREDAPALVELSGALTVVEDDEIRALGEAMLEARSLRTQGEGLYETEAERMEKWMEGAGLRRIQIPGTGKFTLVQLQGRASFDEQALAGSRPLSWDLVRERLISTEGLSEDDADAALVELELDLDAFRRRGDPSQHVRATPAKGGAS